MTAIYILQYNCFR